MNARQSLPLSRRLNRLAAIVVAVLSFSSSAFAQEQRNYTVNELLQLGGQIVGTSDTRIWVAFSNEPRQDYARWYVCTYDVEDPSVRSSCVEFK